MVMKIRIPTKGCEFLDEVNKYQHFKMSVP